MRVKNSLLLLVALFTNVLPCSQQFSVFQGQPMPEVLQSHGDISREEYENDIGKAILKESWKIGAPISAENDETDGWRTQRGVDDENDGLALVEDGGLFKAEDFRYARYLHVLSHIEKVDFTEGYKKFKAAYKQDLVRYRLVLQLLWPWALDAPGTEHMDGDSVRHAFLDFVEWQTSKILDYSGKWARIFGHSSIEFEHSWQRKSPFVPGPGIWPEEYTFMTVASAYMRGKLRDLIYRIDKRKGADWNCPRRAGQNRDTVPIWLRNLLSSWRVGDRVARGPDWKWGNQNGVNGSLGTVTQVNNKRKTDGSETFGWVRVKWDATGKENNYRMGAEGKIDLITRADLVVRGPDWEWGNQDGGNGSPGIVTELAVGRVRVKWFTGGENYYRMGAEGKTDLKKRPRDARGFEIASKIRKQHQTIQAGSRVQVQTPLPAALLQAPLAKLSDVMAENSDLREERNRLFKEQKEQKELLQFKERRGGRPEKGVVDTEA